MARYTDEERAQHVLMLEASGYPKKKGALMQYSKLSGIPHPTLSRWYRGVQNPPPNKSVRIKKRELKDALKDLIFDLVSHAHDAAKDAGLDPVMRGVGIATDKLLLLQDQPTVIIKLKQALENGQITPDELSEKYPSVAAEFFANVD